MPNGTYGGVRGTETKVGQRTFVSRPTRLTIRNKPTFAGQPQKVVEMLKNYPNEKLFLGA